MRIQFEYKNHRGQIEVRDVDVITLAFDFISHPNFGYQPGWFIGGWDYSRGRTGNVYRSFMLNNVILPDSQSTFRLLNLPKESKGGEL